MPVETLIADVEAALVRLLKLGLGARLPSVADLAALAALPLKDDGALCFVSSAGRLFEFRTWSTATPDGVSIVAMASPPSGKTNGRWHGVTTPWRYGAGGVNLAQKTTGYLRTVEAYSSDDDGETAINRVADAFPSCLLKFVGDDLKPAANVPGTAYWDELSFTLDIVTANLRPAPAATQGSSAAGDDPGAYRIIGDIRRLLHGVSPSFAVVEEVERVEVGGASLSYEAEDRRVYVWQLPITVRASYSIDDEDLEAAEVEVQPTLADKPLEATRFDIKNYVASGGGLDAGPGAGFTRTIEATIATVGGTPASAAAMTTTFAPSKDTYRDFSNTGIWSLTAVAAGASPPPLAAGELRVGVTRTDGAGVVEDRPLCSFSIPFGASFTVS